MTCDDGNEIDKSIWKENGAQYGISYLGKSTFGTFDTGFRFHLDELKQGDRIAFARLRFAGRGGTIDSKLNLLIEGVLQNSPSGFSQFQRPSQKNPKTNSKIFWSFDEIWQSGSNDMPLWQTSPNVAPIINEILQLPNWGDGIEGKTLILTISNYGPITPMQNNFVKFNDYTFGASSYKSPVTLEIYRTVYDTFLAKEMLGRVSNKSVVVNLYSLIDTDVYVEYGKKPGLYTHSTKVYINQPAEKPIEIFLNDLEPDTQYYYRLSYRKTGTRVFEKGIEHTFHTQRQKASTFSFGIIADEHIQAMHQFPINPNNMKLYNVTLQNLADNAPDFYLSLGDFAHTEYHGGRNVITKKEAIERYLLERYYIDKVVHSIPFYLVLGNHEGEQAWYYNFEEDDIKNHGSLLIKSMNARKMIIPNPYPDEFYSGNTDPMINMGLREDYYSWEWGDALFVVLDPFAYTKNKPKNNGWDWTLGQQQYNWLYDTLNNSTAKWKFIFMHHLVSTPEPNMYGKGGIEVAKYKVDNRSSFEWGGENQTGENIFNIKRPGWNHGPIHDILLKHNVTALFHGHDHFFAYQELDNIAYILCPRPSDSDYSWGEMIPGKYKYGDFLNNSGHVQVTINPEFVKIEYIRAFLPGDGVNGETAYTKIIN